MKSFHTLGHVESSSALILFFIAMPLKYLMDAPEAVTLVGTIHGALFLIYVIAAGLIGMKQQWGLKLILLSWILACFPLGPVIFEKKFSPKLGA